MHRCITLAKNGKGSTYPNPMVGSVIIYDDKIIGEGWHAKAGEPHAEVVAINSVKDHNLLPNSTIYVSLEPCSHFGKTPPCADLIISKGIKNVVIGCKDPYSKVSGRGIQRLKDAGFDVLVGVMERECTELNKRFITFHQKKRPFIFLKWAQTKDGFIDKNRAKESKKEPIWISNEESRQLAHKLRANEQAILVGYKTVLNDNPKLTTRDWHGKNPLRLVIDRQQKLPIQHHIFADRQKTVIFCEALNYQQIMANIEYVKLDFDRDIPQQICDYLHKLQIQSLIVEGGQKTLQSFIDENLWDEAFIFSGNTTFGNGLKAPRIKGIKSKEVNLKENILEYWNTKS